MLMNLHPHTHVISCLMLQELDFLGETHSLLFQLSGYLQDSDLPGCFLWLWPKELMAKCHENAQSTKWLHHQFLPTSIFLVHEYKVKECDFPPVILFSFLDPLWSVYRAHLIIPFPYFLCGNQTHRILDSNYRREPTLLTRTIIFFSCKVRESL